MFIYVYANIWSYKYLVYITYLYITYWSLYIYLYSLVPMDCLLNACWLIIDCLLIAYGHAMGWAWAHAPLPGAGPLWGPPRQQPHGCPQAPQPPHMGRCMDLVRLVQVMGVDKCKYAIGSKAISNRPWGNRRYISLPTIYPHPDILFCFLRLYP